MNTSTADYSEHRPNDWEWVNFYTSHMGKTDFNTFLDRTFGRLSKMQVGDTYDLTKKVGSKNRDLFIKVACSFIECGNMDYEFSDNYTSIRRNRKPNDKNTVYMPFLDTTVVLERKLIKEQQELKDI